MPALAGDRLPPLRRILVIGSSCAGKSTFAREIAAAITLPYVELDHLYWGPQWMPKPPEEFRTLASKAVAGKRWIVEGNYKQVRDILWPQADMVIWLNYSFPLIFWRALRRTIIRTTTRQVLWHGNRESFKRSFMSRESILVWIVTSFRRRRKQFEALRASDSYPQLEWVEFTHPAQARDFLRQVKHAG